jgi:hypothetical protein
VTANKPYHTMTIREFWEHAGDESSAGARFGLENFNGIPIDPNTGRSYPDAAPQARIHHAVVHQALHGGWHVPLDIITEYPDLSDHQDGDELWQVRAADMDLCNLADERLGSIYRDWCNLVNGDESAYPSYERLRQYARWAREILGGQSPVTSRETFERFVRIRLAGKALGLDLRTAFQAFRNGSRVGDDCHAYVVERAMLEGKPVPPEVLSDFPLVQARYLAPGIPVPPRGARLSDLLREEAPV